MSAKITLVECPRDAMQGWAHMIPTQQKIAYLNALLKVGFDVLDCGSFVSAKAIPQMADTKEVIPQLDMSSTQTKLLTIIANTRGAEEAVQFPQISYLGFPFSISETFQIRNTNKTIATSLDQVGEIQNLCVKHGKELVVYISMGFGNPYGDAYSAEVALQWVGKLSEMGIKIVSMADTVGIAKPDTIAYIFSHLVPEFKHMEIGAHFHSTTDSWEEKMQTAFDNGCLRFDSAIKGIGGCPMAEDELVGNIATEKILNWCERKGLPLQLDIAAFDAAFEMAGSVFI
jgi:hydroxymethylglutaryl-CoA lyase